VNLRPIGLTIGCADQRESPRSSFCRITIPRFVGRVVLSGTGAELLENQRVREAYLRL
jgi:hypothetical protein